jgi:hypothetical protein
MKAAMGKGKAVLGMFFFIFAVVLFSAFAAGDEPPEPIPGPEAMNLTADPASIYLGGDTSIITATVYDNANYTEPMSNIGVTFNTSLGGITYLSPGGKNIAPDECGAQTNESGVAMALLISELEAGDATVYAWTGAENVITETVVVEFKQPEYGVALILDNQTKETESGENVTYYIEVRNIGTGADSYFLNLTSEAEFAWLNKTNVTLSGGESEEVELNVTSSFAGSYNTTVEAAGTHASANVTVTTLVKSFHNLSLAVSPEDPQIVAPGVNARYTVTVTNRGNANDRFNLAKEVPAGVTATLSKDITDLLSPEESEGILLNVSSALEGEHVVNVTATSEGNTSVNATVTTKTVVTREGFEFDTGAGTYPSVAGVHRGTIKPNHTVIVKKMYTYPCAGTGGHTEFVEISNGTWSINASWSGYYGDYITFPEIFTLAAGQEYSYEISTGSYPRIIHKQNHTTSDGFINCTSFVDVNGNDYDNWIPAIRLFP